MQVKRSVERVPGGMMFVPLFLTKIAWWSRRLSRRATPPPGPAVPAASTR